MDDMISRRLAINGAKSIIERDTSGNNDVVKAMEAWVAFINALPSAQPDLSGYSNRLWKNAYERGKADAEIQKMQDLEQAEIQKAYELGKLDAMEEIPRWVPCSERLPYVEYGESDRVVATCGFRDVEDTRVRWTKVLYFNGRVWCYPTGEVYNQNVYAWMPLPEPWKGDTNEPDKQTD